MKSLLYLIFAVTFIFSCSTDTGFTIDKSPFISIKGQHFLDPMGRELTLHGINVVNKNPETGYLGHVSREDFIKFRQWGFNVVRLGIIWDGLEPEPGKYNEEYLKGIDEIIQLAEEQNIYVYLDMHQDLYSKIFSDGAPEWATLTDSLPHQTGEIWSDSYLMSPAVQRAFDNFWLNKKASDGIGIKDHYLNLWKHIAERYKNNPTVIGYDIMNEPFMGSAVNQLMPLMAGTYANLQAKGAEITEEDVLEVLQLWSIEKERLKILQSLSEKEVYRMVIDAIYEVSATFEKTTLTQFFQQARNEIRTVDTNHIIFLEHNYFTNMGVTGGLQPIVDENGNPDSLIAYAAHGYDLVVDTDAIAAGSNDRVELIFERIAESGQRLNMPVLIGEWGALPNKNPELESVADFLMNTFNKHQFSDTYWAYGQHMKDASYLKILQKPYPVAVSGELLNYKIDWLEKVFTCEYKNNPALNVPTLLYVPNKNSEFIIEPNDTKWEIKEIDNTEAAYILISSMANEKITIAVNNP